MGAERSQWQFPANEVGKVIGWSDEASPSNPSASKGLVNKGPFATPAELDGKQDAAANLTTLSSSTLGTTGLNLLATDTVEEAATALNVKALNADGGFTFATTATTVNVAGVFGGTWVVGHRLHSTDAATFSGSRATIAVMREATGSGTNGPSRADYAAHFEAIKTDWLTSAVQGEIDTLMVNTRQGELGDSGSILINHSKVQSASYGAVGIEMTLDWVAATTGTSVRRIRTMVGGHIPSTDVRQGGLGFQAQVTTGTARTGYLVYDNGGTWMFPFLAASSISTGSEYFYVTGPGHPDGSGRMRTGDGSAAAPAWSFCSQAGLGFFRNGSGVIGTASGGASININFGPAGMRIGSGLTDPGAGKLNVLSAVQINGNQVVGARKTGWGRASGTFTRTTFATGSVTLPQLAERVAALIEDFHADSGHGVIGS